MDPPCDILTFLYLFLSKRSDPIGLVLNSGSRLAATKGWFKVVGISFIMFNVYRFVIK